MDMNIILYLLIGLPKLAEVGYLFNVMRITTILSAILILILTVLIHSALPIAGLFYITNFNWILILMVGSIYLLSALFSYDYLKERSIRMDLNYYYVFMNLFVATMLFSLIINNYGLMWAGIEATTITSALLVMTEQTSISVEAAWRYIIIVSVGLVFAFMSIILIYYNFHTLTVTQILSIPNRSSEIVTITVAIALVGFGTKIGIFPMHTWLPDVHSEAPAPVSALFSGVLLPVALYVLYLIYQIKPLDSLFILFSLATIIVASIFMTYQKNYKRMFAYSSMENMGIALLGLSIGGYGIIGALAVLFAHSFAKAGAFYSSGNILHSTGERNISKVNGLIHDMKTTSSALLLSSLAVTGAPPFGVFVGEFLIFIQMLRLHLYLEFAIVLFFLMVAFISINYNVNNMVFGKWRANKEAKGILKIIPLVSALISLLIGIVLIVVIA
jgi:hydrogenase-4 component F